MSIYDSSANNDDLNRIFGTNSNPFESGGGFGPTYVASSIKLPTWSRWVNIATLVVSVFLWIPVFMGLGTDNAVIFAVIGYLLTPFISTGLLIVARTQHLNLQKTNGYLDADGREKVKVVGIISAISFLICLPHIYYLANYIGVALL
jgi:hypothetical protein